LLARPRFAARIRSRLAPCQLLLFAETILLCPQTGGYFVSSLSLRVTPLKRPPASASMSPSSPPETPPRASANGSSDSGSPEFDGSSGHQSDGGSGFVGGGAAVVSSLAAAISGAQRSAPLAAGPAGAWPAVAAAAQPPLAASYAAQFAAHRAAGWGPAAPPAHGTFGGGAHGVPAPPPSPPPGLDERASIFVRRLPLDVTQQAIVDSFSRFGAIVRIVLKSTAMRAFAFIDYDTPQARRRHHGSARALTPPRLPRVPSPRASSSAGWMWR